MLLKRVVLPLCQQKMGSFELHQNTFIYLDTYSVMWHGTGVTSLLNVNQSHTLLQNRRSFTSFYLTYALGSTVILESGFAFHFSMPHYYTF